MQFLKIASTAGLLATAQIAFADPKPIPLPLVGKKPVVLSETTSGRLNHAFSVMEKREQTL